MDMVINATAAPTMALTNGSATIGGPVSFLFRALCTNGTKAHVFTLVCPLRAAVSISIVAGTGAAAAPAVMHANFTSAECSMTLASTTIGNVHATLLSAAIEFVTDEAMLPYANKMLAAGFTLPSYDNLTLTGPQLIIDRQTIFVDSDLHWHT
jgi:hypothetical protein